MADLNSNDEQKGWFKQQEHKQVMGMLENIRLVPIDKLTIDWGQRVDINTN